MMARYTWQVGTAMWMHRPPPTFRKHCSGMGKVIAVLRESPGPALCIAVALRVSSMVHTIKAVDVVPAVGGKHLLTPSTELDAGQEGCSAAAVTMMRPAEWTSEAVIPSREMDAGDPWGKIDRCNVTYVHSQSCSLFTTC